VEVVPYTEILIYNPEGIATYKFQIPDRLEYIGGRICKGSKYWYKGVGTVYRCHHELYKGEELPDVSYHPPEVFYYGHRVIYERWLDKFGIFLKPMQPYFSDLIGSCGPKELKIVPNSTQFGKSAVVVENVTKWSDDYNGQYYMTLSYKCREKYQTKPNPDRLLNLLEFMVENEWCTPWDKNFINDITITGEISDVGDLFRSSKLQHIFGTVYATLHSLWKQNKTEFERVSKKVIPNDIPFEDGLWAGVFIGYVTAKIVGVRNIPVLDTKNTVELAERLLIQFLITDKNCAGIEQRHWGDKVRKQYLKRLKKQIKKWRK